MQDPRAQTFELAKNFSFVADAGQKVYGQWVAVNGQQKLWNTHVHCQTLSPTAGLTTGITVEVETSYDTVEANQVGSNIHVTATGSSDDAITANVARYVRVVIGNQEAFMMMGIVSVWVEMEIE